jgi:stress response protein YsnF
MREPATLKLDAGEEVRVEVDREALERDEIVVRRTDDRATRAADELLGIVDAHLASAASHAAGTTDRLIAADRQRPY